MALSRSNVNYEVHVLQKGRWEIHARYPDKREKAALDEAKQLDTQPGIDAVRVIRETYNPIDGSSADSIIYASPGHRDSLSESGGGSGSRHRPGDSSAGPQVTSYGQGGSDGGTLSAFDGSSGSRGKKSGKGKKGSEATTFTGLIVRILMVILFCVVVSLVVTGIAFPFLSESKVFGFKMSSNARTNSLFVIFMTTFFLTAIPIAKSILSKARISSSPAQPVQAPPPPPPPRKTRRSADVIPSMPVEDERKKKDKKKKPGEADETEPGKEEKAEEEKEPEEEQAPEEEEKPEEEPEDGEPGEEEETDDGLSPQTIKEKAFMMKFLDEAIDRGDMKSMDNFNKFGVNLFLAGSCEALRKEHELDESTAAQVLSECVQVVGFKKEHAESFSGKYQEYLLADSRYMKMFQAGRNAMNTYSSGDESGVDTLKGALEDWNKPKQKEDTTGPVTVMFTDMVGSTALTQAKGDAVAQQVVRAHNRITRDALTDCAGREIKHTGDGIMASFTSTSSGVEAAIKIQRGTVVHNKANPDLPVYIKIGINAGEPIAEDDDLFGTTVQLAARITDKAQSEEIFVSEIVRGICAGKSLKFTSRGGYDMKGFGEPINLYEVVWRQEEDQGEAEAPAT